MEHIDFDHMALDDMTLFKNRFIKIFLSLKAHLEESLKTVNEHIPEKYRSDNPDFTRKRMLKFLGKKLFANTLFSLFTGTDPMYLDSGIDALTPQGVYNRYMRTQPIILTKCACEELITGIDEVVARLNSSDENELRKTLTALDAAYQELADTTIKENLPCYAIYLAWILERSLNVLKYKTRYKIDVLYKKTYSLVLSENFIKEFEDVYSEYQNQNV